MTAETAPHHARRALERRRGVPGTKTRDGGRQAAAVAPTAVAEVRVNGHNDTAHGVPLYAFALSSVIVKQFSKKDRLETLPALYAGVSSLCGAEHAARAARS